MSLIHLPLSGAGHRVPAPTGRMVPTMAVGQHLMAVVLTVIGTTRAAADGVALPLAVGAGLAMLVWHTAGSLLAAGGPAGRSGPPGRSGLRVVGWLVGLALIWVAAVVVSSEFVWLAFLLWLLAGHLLPLRWGLAFSAVVLVVTVSAPVLHHGVTSYANVIGPLIGGIFAFGISRGYLQLLRDAIERERLVASLTTAQQEMADLQDELVLAQRHSGAVAERTRIARDLHDTVAQSLSSIRLLAHAGGHRSPDPDATRALGQVEALAADGLTDVRRVIEALAPAELEDDALAAALGRMLGRAAEETGLQTQLHVDESLPALPPAVEVALLRTAQSALANVRQHAGATRVAMSLVDTGDTVRLDLIDDGAGFDLAGWERDPGVASGHGLAFMRARLRELGGGIDLETAPGEGTAISAHLPLRTRRED